MRWFEARWDGRLRASTALLSALLLLVPLGGAWLLLREDEVPGLALAAALAPALLLPLVAALAPRGYALERGRLVVERALRPVAIPLADVRRVALLPAGALRGAVRLLGTSGLFGHYGSFRSPALGPFRAYATRTHDGLVLVETHRERLVVTPESPERFVEALLGVAAGAERADGAALPPGPQRRRPDRRGRLGARGALVAASVAAGPVVAATVLGLSWARGPSSIAVRGGDIRVERRLGAPLLVPLASVREAAWLTPEQRRGWRRTSGVALGDLAYGRFRSDALGPFELYAYKRGLRVVVRTDGGILVFGPDEPGRFLAEVQAALPR